MAQILIVEDDTRLAQQLAQHLTHAGHTCDHEPHGEKALVRIDEKAYALVILDVMLPGLSGFEVCRRVRTSDDHFTLPILMISSMGSREEMQHGLSQGADDFLPKPLQLKEVLERSALLIRASVDNGNGNGSSDGDGNGNGAELAGSRAIKMEMQRAISRQQSFGVVYAELLHLNQFARVAGIEGRDKAVRHMGRTLLKIGRELAPPLVRVGHLGGGHFLCLISAEAAVAYCDQVQQFWEGHLPSLYEQVGLDKIEAALAARRKTRSLDESPLIDTLMCLTFHEADQTVPGVQQMFEQVSHLRRSALEGHARGIYCDRRYRPGTG